MKVQLRIRNHWKTHAHSNMCWSVIVIGIHYIRGGPYGWRAAHHDFELTLFGFGLGVTWWKDPLSARESRAYTSARKGRSER